MFLERKSISDGVSFRFFQTDKFKTNYMRLQFAVPLTRENASLYSLLVNVLMRGSAEYPSMRALNRRLSFLYNTRITADTSKRGEILFVNFSLAAIADGYAFDKIHLLEEALKVLYSLLRCPLASCGGFDTEYTRQEKENLCGAIRARINHKDTYSYERCLSYMCAGEAFSAGRDGEADIVSSLTPQLLYQGYEALLQGAPCEIFFVGQDASAAENFAHALFSGLLRHPRPFPETAVLFPRGELRKITETESMNQGKLNIGFRFRDTLTTGNSFRYALFCELYAASPSGLLFKNVREKLSLCYYCRPILDTLKGVMVIAAGVENRNAEKAAEEIFSQLDVIRRGAFSEEELTYAKYALASSYREIADSQRALMSYYLSRLLSGVSPEQMPAPEQAADMILALDAEDVRQAANGCIADTVYFMKAENEKAGGAEDAGV